MKCEHTCIDSRRFCVVLVCLCKSGLINMGLLPEHVENAFMGVCACQFQNSIRRHFGSRRSLVSDSKGKSIDKDSGIFLCYSFAYLEFISYHTPGRFLHIAMTLGIHDESLFRWPAIAHFLTRIGYGLWQALRPRAYYIDQAGLRAGRDQEVSQEEPSSRSSEAGWTEWKDEQLQSQNDYYFGLQPLVSTTSELIAVEMLLRHVGGGDRVPVKDLLALYSQGCPTSFLLQQIRLAVKLSFGPLSRLSAININFRKEDLESSALHAVLNEVRQLPLFDKLRLLFVLKLEILSNRIVDDGVMEESRERAILEKLLLLGFHKRNLSLDDLTSRLLGGDSSHRIDRCSSLLPYVGQIKLDMHWAKYIFLSAPMWTQQVRDAALLSAQQDQILDQGGSYSELLAEFVDFCLRKASNVQIVIELTVTLLDNAYALERLRKEGLDIFGEHKERFLIQGGLSFAAAPRSDLLLKFLR